MADPIRLATVREVVAQVEPEARTKPLLKKIADIMKVEQNTLDNLASPILLYTRLLEDSGQYELSNNTLAALHERARRFNDRETVRTTAMRLGYAQRISGDFDSSDEYYRIALRYTDIQEYPDDYFGVSLGVATNIARRGNISAAETMCADLIPVAESIGIGNIIGKIQHSRGTMIAAEDDALESISWFRRAIHNITEERASEPAYADLGSLLTSHGYLEEAKCIHTRLAQSGRTAIVRWQSVMNLMYTAVLEGRPADFELYRLSLEVAPLPPWQEMWFHWYAAQGYHSFGKLGLAEKEMQIARNVAARNNMHSDKIGV